MNWYDDEELQAMCEGAVELHNEKIRWGDFYLLNGQVHLWSGKQEINAEHCIKLHSQEDLQEKIKEGNLYNLFYDLIIDFKSFVMNLWELYSCNVLTDFFDSYVKLWLAFYMHELYQKTWDPEAKKWEEEK